METVQVDKTNCMATNVIGSVIDNYNANDTITNTNKYSLPINIWTPMDDSIFPSIVNEVA